MISRIGHPAVDLLSMVRAVLGFGVGWAVLWLVGWVIACGVIAIVDPDSIDPGDWEGLVTVMTPMGFLSGVATGILTALAGRATAPRALPARRAAMWGVLGTAIVQLGYLGHGDAGLASNLAMALMFSAVGGIVTAAWLFIQRRLSRWWTPRAARG